VRANRREEDRVLERVCAKGAREAVDHLAAAREVVAAGRVGWDEKVSALCADERVANAGLVSDIARKDLGATRTKCLGFCGVANNDAYLFAAIKQRVGNH